MNEKTPLSASDIARLIGRPQPTAEQSRVIESPLHSALVVAGAGAGKTETMASRVVYLVANEVVTPEQVLALTFTRKAAAELSERIRSRLSALAKARSDGPSGRTGMPAVSTYNAYAQSVLRDHALRLGIDPEATLLTQTARWAMASRIVEQWDGKLETELATSTLVSMVLQLADQVSEHEVDPEQVAEELRSMVTQLDDTVPVRGSLGEFNAWYTRGVRRSLIARAEVMPMVTAFLEAKRQAGSIDFADQVALARRLAETVPQVAKGEREKYSCVLLDEYQDTSVGQIRFLRALFGSVGESSNGKTAGRAGPPVMAVGDPLQSIYGWRGASAAGLEQFPDDFPKPDGGPADVLTLSVSWRNSRSILDLANRVAAPLRRRSALAFGPGQSIPELLAAPSAGAGQVRATMSLTSEEEAAAVAEYLREQLYGPPAYGEENERVRPQNRRALTAAVLCRARDSFGRIASALEERGIPYEIVGIGGLTDTPEVQDVMSLLTVAHDPSRGDALMRLLTGPGTRLGIRDLAGLRSWVRRLVEDDDVPQDVPQELLAQRSIVDALENLPPASWQDARGVGISQTGRRRLKQVRQAVRTVRSLTYLPVPELLGIAERLLRLDIELPLVARRGRRHLEQLGSFARTFVRDAGSDASVGAFIDWIENAKRHENGLEPAQIDPDPQAVQILTMHAAKGLEWDVVALPGIVQGVMPKLTFVEADGEIKPSAPGWLSANTQLPGWMRADGTHLPQFAAESENTEGLNEEYRSFRLSSGEYQLLEDSRVFYVALTRAASCLLVSGYRWDHTAKPRQTSIFMDQMAAFEDTIVSGWHEFPPEDQNKPDLGDATSAWWPARATSERRIEALEAAASLVREQDVNLALESIDGLLARQVAQLLQERDERSRELALNLPRHLTASDAVRLRSDPALFALDLRRPVPHEPSYVTGLGSAFHEWVENYLMGSGALSDQEEDSTEVGRRERSIGSRDVPARALGRLRAAFEATPWANPGGSLVPIAVEQSLETKVGSLVLRCRIDAIFRRADGDLEVVDWKTGSVPVEETELENRATQLALYRLAVSRVYRKPLDRVHAIFHYIAHGQTIRPVDGLTEDQIEALLRLGDEASRKG